MQGFLTGQLPLRFRVYQQSIHVENNGIQHAGNLRRKDNRCPLVNLTGSPELIAISLPEHLSEKV